MAVGSLLKNWRHDLVARLRLTAAIVGIALFAYNLMPSLTANARTYRAQIVALAKAVKSGKSLDWPRQIGPFTFYNGSANDDGVLLGTMSTTDYGDGDWGIQWSQNGALTYSWGARAVAPNLWLISR